MIDTIGFKVNVSPDLAEGIRQRSNEIVSTNNETKEEKFRIIKKELNLGSYDSKITIRYSDDDFIHAELSIPKFIFGHNIFLLYPSQIEQSLIKLEKYLSNYFGSFPSYKNWQIERLDFCYAWRFNNQDEAIKIVNVLKSFEFPRKSKNKYPTSVQWSGRTYSLKFYLKQPEIVKHAFKEIKDDEIRSKLFKLAEGVVRFEITCRKAQVKQLFGEKEIYFDSITDEDLILGILNSFLKRLISNLNPNTTNKLEVVEKLNKIFSKRKVQFLMNFYEQWYSENEFDRQLVKDTYSQSTIWRKKHDLSVAGVGIPQIDIPLNFSIDIPSSNVVNKPIDFALAKDLGEDSNTA